MTIHIPTRIAYDSNDTPDPDKLYHHFLVLIAHADVPCKHYPPELLDISPKAKPPVTEPLKNQTCRKCPYMEICRVYTDQHEQYSLQHEHCACIAGGETPRERAGRRAAYLKQHGTLPWYVPIEQKTPRGPRSKRKTHGPAPSPEQGEVTISICSPEEKMHRAAREQFLPLDPRSPEC